MRYAMDRPHRCLVVWADGPTVDLRPERLRQTVPALFRGNAEPAIVTLPLGPSIAVWWSPPDPRALAVPEQIDPAVRGAIGPVAHGIAGFRASYLDALGARRVAVLEQAPAGSLTDHADVAVRALASADLEQAARFVRGALGDLGETDPAVRELAATLHAFLDHGSNLRATASAMGVHHNTVANRIRRAEALLPHPTVGRTAEILLALELLAIADHTGGHEPHAVGARAAAGAALPGLL
ncbi:MAG: helix-turn-helix domain-containing protein [Patulibacter minatonensis]